MLSYVLFFLAADVALLIGMQIDSPLFYKVIIISTNPYGAITESRGECTADTTKAWPWLGLLIGIHGMLLIFGNILVYQLRTVPSEFNEGKYVGFSLANNLQTSVLALMLLFLSYDNPSVTPLAKWFEIYWSSTVSLLMMFVPKMFQVHFGDDDQTLAEANQMRLEARNSNNSFPQGARATKTRASSIVRRDSAASAASLTPCDPETQSQL